MTVDPSPLQGRCACHYVRSHLQSKPMFVHCCHCRSCQRESGASYAVNAPIESDRVELLEEPERVPPDIHIFTVSKQPWVALGEDVPAVPEFYKASEHWPGEGLERRAALFESRSD